MQFLLLLTGTMKRMRWNRQRQWCRSSSGNWSGKTQTLGLNLVNFLVKHQMNAKT